MNRNMSKAGGKAGGEGGRGGSWRGGGGFLAGPCSDGVTLPGQKGFAGWSLAGLHALACGSDGVMYRCIGRGGGMMLFTGLIKWLYVRLEEARNVQSCLQACQLVGSSHLWVSGRRRQPPNPPSSLQSVTCPSFAAQPANMHDVENLDKHVCRACSALPSLQTRRPRETSPAFSAS